MIIKKGRSGKSIATRWEKDAADALQSRFTPAVSFVIFYRWHFLLLFCVDIFTASVHTYRCAFVFFFNPPPLPPALLGVTGLKLHSNGSETGVKLLPGAQRLLVMADTELRSSSSRWKIEKSRKINVNINKRRAAGAPPFKRRRRLMLTAADWQSAEAIDFISGNVAICFRLHCCNTKRPTTEMSRHSSTLWVLSCIHLVLSRCETGAELMSKLVPNYPEFAR